jgi:hypothetical protein
MPAARASFAAVAIALAIILLLLCAPELAVTSSRRGGATASVDELRLAASGTDRPRRVGSRGQTALGVLHSGLPTVNGVPYV